MVGAFGPITVVTPGTLVRVWTPPGALPNKTQPIHGVMFQALPSNQGIVYIGRAGFVRATSVGVLGFVGKPATDGTAIPSFTVTHTIAPNGLTLGDFYVDADEAGDGVIVTVLIT